MKQFLTSVATALATATLLICLFFSPPAYAQTQPPVNPYIIPNTTSDVKPSLHTWVPAVMDEIMASMVCFLAGIDPITKTDHCLGVTPNGKLGYVQEKGINKMMASTIDTLYQNGFPVSTGTYIAYLRSNFGPVKHAYAANDGYHDLLPLVSIWAVLRNVAYLLMVIAFMLVGMAIMFRVKIDPRTVMTIENQLPKLIMGLIFVTFSFAIAGIMVDGMNIFNRLIVNVYNTITFSNTNGGNTSIVPIKFDDNIQNALPWNAVDALLPGNKIKTIPYTVKGPSISLLPATIPIHVPFPWSVFGVSGIDWDISTSWLPRIQIPDFNLSISFGPGTAGLAADAAFSFSPILASFLKIQPSQATAGIGLMSAIPRVGPILTVIPILIDNLTKGSPVGFILDVLNSIASGGATTRFIELLGNWLSKISVLGNVPAPITGSLSFLAQGAVFTGLFTLFDYLIKNFALPIIIWLLVYLAIFLATARLFFGLLFAWTSALFKICIGPLLIIFGLVPGMKNVGLTYWIKSLAADIMAFPITIGLLLLGSAIIQSIINVQNPFLPPLLGGGQFPLPALLGITVIFAASNGPQLAKDLFEEKDNKNFGAFGANAGTALQTYSKVGSAAAFGRGKTPMPGSPGGWQAAWGRLGI